MTTASDLMEAERRIRASVETLGPALASVETYTPPALARAVQAEQNLYERIEAEFGLLTAGEAGRQLGSRSTAPRNLAAAARRAGRLVTIRWGSRTLYPGFQLGRDGQPLPVIAELRDLATERGWSETGLVQWLCGPTTYLDGRRPVDLLHTAPREVVDTASRAWAIQW